MSDWPPITPRLTVDTIIRTDVGIVLVERKYEPFGWAIPGGFVEIGETVENAAIREAREETGLDAKNLWLLGVYSDPERDPRFHTVSVVYGSRASGEPIGADDAKTARAFNIEELPDNIAFDHLSILSDFFRIEPTRGQ